MSIPNTAHERPEGCGQQGAHKQLAVVARRRIRRHRTTHEIGHAAYGRTLEPDAARTKESEGEKPGQQHVQHEAPRHGDVGWQEHAQQKCRIENVAVHRSHVGHATELVWIPEWETMSFAKRSRGKLTERVTGDVLVGVRIDQECAAERRPREQQRGDGGHHSRPDEWTLRCWFG